MKPFSPPMPSMINPEQQVHKSQCDLISEMSPTESKPTCQKEDDWMFTVHCRTKQCFLCNEVLGGSKRRKGQKFSMIEGCYIDNKGACAIKAGKIT